MPYIYNDEDNAPMNEHMLPADKNCHERCPYSRQCWELFHCKGSHDVLYPSECACYDKIANMMMEAEDIPFYDPDNPPEEDLEEDEDGTDS